jgi:hypothetical protein
MVKISKWELLTVVVFPKIGIMTMDKQRRRDIDGT